MKDFNKVILFFIINITIFANITGYGNKITLEEAKKEALVNLANQISVKVDSEFYKEVNVDEKNNYSEKKSNKIKLTTIKEFLGVEFIINKLKSGYEVYAVLDKEDIPLYLNEIDKLNEKISYKLNIKEENLLKEKEKYKEVISLLEKIEDYRYILNGLGYSKNIKMIVSVTKIENNLEEIEKKLNEKKYLYIDIRKSFKNILYNDYLIKDLNRKLEYFANNNNIMITTNKTKGNIIVKINIDNNITEKTKPFYYNNKKISNGIYKNSLTVTIEIYDKRIGSIIGEKNINTTSKSVISKDSVIKNNIKKISAEINKEIKKALQTNKIVI
ncbi:LPP20 lipoprotein [Hypnocyclicus thermotrophus]|uniref:LPP20 lipoprotein n=1 Tax=Hypnocyclicus thermotrophus TaxID=1627895 RepID=A0AA46DZN8_9FUSO|nr:LPP20 family lipoprotein [Hypnocyclicus thermotrophus]TDT71932.1 LPP20 lipoprotein [Hypnocyclicus thermotrophus]